MTEPSMTENQSREVCVVQVTEYLPVINKSWIGSPALHRSVMIVYLCNSRTLETEQGDPNIG